MRKLLAPFVAVSLIAAPAFADSSRDDFARLVAGLGILGGVVAVLASSEGPQVQFEILETGIATFPADHESHHVRHGEALYTQYNYRAIAQATLQRRFLRGAGAVIYEGTELFKMSTGEWCQLGSAGFCFADKDGDGRLDSPGRDLETSKKIDVPYTTRVLHIDVPSEGFRTELVYQGAGGAVLRLAYREFVDDMARPAFTQELTYELPPEGATTIAFQGLEVEILDANNLGVEYRVRSTKASGETRPAGLDETPGVGAGR
jgi:hypothetical protein